MSFSQVVRVARPIVRDVLPYFLDGYTTSSVADPQVLKTLDGVNDNLRRLNTTLETRFKEIDAKLDLLVKNLPPPKPGEVVVARTQIVVVDNGASSDPAKAESVLNVMTVARKKGYKIYNVDSGAKEKFVNSNKLTEAERALLKTAFVAAAGREPFVYAVQDGAMVEAGSGSLPANEKQIIVTLEGGK